DYVNVIKHVQAVVKEKFGVDLETEVRILGN
ncbi:MAG: UDP-N-acetylmuramate dehydrogenase, partial [Weissella cibaria]